MRPARSRDPEIRKRIDHEGLLEQAVREEANGNRRIAKCWRFAGDEFAKGNPGPVKFLKHLRQFPVPIDEFIEGNEFLGSDSLTVWDSLRADLRIMNPDIVAGEPAVHEYVFGGATGTGKSFTAMVTQAYQLYVLLCLSEPQILYGLQRHTPLVFAFIASYEQIARRVLYRPFREMFTAIPWVKRYAPYDKTRESELWFQGGILIRPMLASVQQILGQALMSSIIDEVNFMSYVRESSKVVGEGGAGGGEFDQAEDIYRNASRRRKSRFPANIPSPGCLAVQSSARYKGDFLYRRVEQIERHGEQTPVFFHKQYEVRPSSEFCGETFRLLVGTEAFETRILEDDEVEGEDYPTGARIENVPVEYLVDFRNDPEASLRDVVGLATMAISPFFKQRAKITAAVTRGKESKLMPFVSRQNVVLTPRIGLPSFIEDKMPGDRMAPRFAHIDLSLTKDSCGVAMVKYCGHVEVETGDNQIEQLPRVEAELLVTIKPNENQEVDIADVRRWVLSLSTTYGFNLRALTFDGFQSAESIQTSRKAGVRSHVVSIDRTSEPYQVLKSMIYTDRLDMVDNDLTRRELLQLEYNQAKDKIDHPMRGSKDSADALCGAVYSLTKDRVIRHASRVVGPSGRVVGGGRPVANRVRRRGRRNVF